MSQFKSHSLLSCFPPLQDGFDIKRNHQIILTTLSHASHCHHCNYYHYCNVDFVLFHNVTCYNTFFLSRIHVNTTKLLNITCTLVATSVILRVQSVLGFDNPPQSQDDKKVHPHQSWWVSLVISPQTYSLRVILPIITSNANEHE